jgi:hypothetical protein
VNRCSTVCNVEKVVYLLIDGDPDVGPTLRTDTVAAVRAAGGKRIQVNVVDADLGPPFGVAPDSGASQLTAVMAAWVNSAEGSRLGSALPPAGPGGSWVGYLVIEAEPLPNTTVNPGPDGRVPGFAQMVPLTVPEGLGWGEWRRRWQSNHTSIALATQSTFRYVQNVVLRPLTAGAPRYAAIVEECFPLAAATDLHVFFDAVGDEAKLARHMAAMSESCDRFMDGVAPVAWTAEYLFDDGA